jgi:chromosome segregation ATPase
MGEEANLPEKAATQPVGADDMDAYRKSIGKKATPSGNVGIIQRIYIENFMCHKRLTLNFGPNINFITGSNGSGKSAILAAIQMALGSSAKETHRSTKSGDLVRWGHEGSAAIAVTISNEGSDAYEPEKYGSSITIERRLTRKGGSEFLLTGTLSTKVVSKSRKDVDAIRAHMNIDVANPCCVLDQETFKTFIKDSPEDKYAFFLKATELDTLGKALIECDVNMEAASEEIRQKNMELPKLEEKVRLNKELLAEAQAYSEIDTNISEWQGSLLWKRVEEREERLNALKDELAKATDKKEQRETKQGELLERKRVLEAKKAAIKEEDQQLDQQSMAVSTQIGEIENEKQNVMNILKELKKKEVGSKKEVEGKVREIKQLKSEVEKLAREERDRLNRIANEKANVDKNQAKYINNLHEARNRYEAAEQNKRSLESSDSHVSSELDEVHIQIRTKEDEAGKAEDRKRILENRLSEIAENIRSLEGAQTDDIAKFGGYQRELRNAIDRACRDGKFEGRPPVGPLGAHIKLRGGMLTWAKAVETVITWDMTAYLVDTYNDSLLVKRLVGEICRDKYPPNVIIRGDHQARYSIPESDLPSESIITIANVLTVDNDRVYNFLVDRHGIEKKALVVDTREADRLCRGDALPRNVTTIVTRAELKHLTFNFGSQKWVDRDSRTSYLTEVKDHKAVIAERRKEEGEKRRELELVAQHLHDYSETLVDLRRRRDLLLRQKRERDQRVEHASNEARSAYRDLHRAEQDYETHCRKDAEEDEDFETQVFKQTQEEQGAKIAESQHELAILEKKYEACSQVLRQRKDEIEGTGDASMAEKLRQLEAEQSAILAKRQAGFAAEDVLLEEIRTIDTDLQRGETYMTKKVGEIEELTNQLMDGEKKLEQMREGALEIRPERPAHIELSSKDLQDKITVAMKLKAKREKAGQQIDLLETQREYDRSLRDLEEAQNLVKRTHDMIHTLMKTQEKRKEGYARAKKHISQQVNQAFTAHLVNRKQNGRVRIDHERKAFTLSMQADISNKSKSSKITDTKQLSGGERSYATLSLILALGEVVDSPFRVMDEFDVAMDDTNRKHSLRMVVDYGKDNKNRQFICITPNDLSAILGKDMVKVLKVASPLRNNAVLEFTEVVEQ